MKSRPDHAAHKALASEVIEARQRIHKLCSFVYENYPKTSGISKKATRLRASMTAFVSELDKEYHDVTSDSEFAQNGYVYFPKKQL